VVVKPVVNWYFFVQLVILFMPVTFLLICHGYCFKRTTRIDMSVARLMTAMQSIMGY